MNRKEQKTPLLPQMVLTKQDTIHTEKFERATSIIANTKKKKKKKSLSLVYKEKKANRELDLNKDSKLGEQRFESVDNYRV